MEALVRKGKVRSIGVSNFTRENIEALLLTYVFCPDLWFNRLRNIRRASITPAVNQIEAHPYFQQPALLEWLKEKVSQKSHIRRQTK
jgi:diketogulonate reductase-like aldo/keto reductase